MGLFDRLKHAWNAFTANDKDELYTAPSYNLGLSSTYRPDRLYFTRGNERSIVTAVYNRIAVDCSRVDIKHVKLDDNGRYSETINSDLNHCLTIEANKDQASKAFIQDIVESLFDEGCIAIVPIDTTLNINKTSAYDIQTMRTGRIITWYPDYIQVNVYNDRTGNRENILMPKKDVAIIENPLYSIMNERNSVLQRLIRKLNILDAIDEQSGSGKLNLIIQLPYVVKTETRKTQAESRQKEIEKQLVDSKYGIAYIDGTEKITQLNRSIDNNLMSQIEYLTSMLYSQLGITQAVLDGTADEKTMLNYMNRTVTPVVSAIVEEMKRKFLTQTARSQGQDIMFFNDPFKLMPVSNLADIADKFTRNEIMSSNEIRQIIGLKPINDPKADELRNKNLNAPENGTFPSTTEENGDSGTNDADTSQQGVSAATKISDLPDISDFN